ncbi:MAG: PKD domain-containing protein, partial [Candidatus Hydrogenedentes bacterium]|nr:PKD domain-containing protein [Candidatus Hydrogenedentota bacterium]
EDGTIHTQLSPGLGANDIVTLENAATLRGFTIGAAPAAAVVVPGGRDATVTNCVLFGSGSGIEVAAESTLTCINNTFYENEIGLRGDAGSLLNPVRNNAFSKNGIGISVDPDADIATGFNAFDFDNGLNFQGAFPNATDLASRALYVDPENLNFHLGIFSRLRNAGDPAAAYVDLDNTRNDIGADGGPNGALDALAPVARIATDPAPPDGQAPFLVQLDGSGSSDEWGIAFYEWDLDAADGFSPEITQPATLATYGAPGEYTATLRVTDNSGRKSTATVQVRVGSPPVATALATPNIGTAPLTVQFSAASPGGPGLSYAWEFDGAGEIDSTEQNPTFTYPANTPAGAYLATVSISDDESVFAQARVPVTIAAFPPDASGEYTPGEDFLLQDNTGALAGTSVALGAEASGQPLVVGIAALTEDDVPLKPDGSALAYFAVAPSQFTLSQPATISVSLADADIDPASVRVLFLDGASQAWFDRGISRVRVTPEGNGLQVVFDTAQLGIFAIAGPEGETPNPPDGGCAAGALNVPPNPFSGDAILIAMLVALLTLAGIRGQRMHSHVRIPIQH